MVALDVMGESGQWLWREGGDGGLGGGGGEGGRGRGGESLKR